MVVRIQETPNGKNIVHIEELLNQIFDRWVTEGRAVPAAA